MDQDIMWLHIDVIGLALLKIWTYPVDFWDSTLKSIDDNEGGDSSCMPDKALIQQCSEFYVQDNLPHTKAMMKCTIPTLDVYSIFLPSRMWIWTTVSQDVTDATKYETNGNQEECNGLEEYVGEGEDERGVTDSADKVDKEKDDVVVFGVTHWVIRRYLFSVWKIKDQLKSYLKNSRFVRLCELLNQVGLSR